MADANEVPRWPLFVAGGALGVALLLAIAVIASGRHKPPVDIDEAYPVKKKRSTHLDRDLGIDDVVPPKVDDVVIAPPPPPPPPPPPQLPQVPQNVPPTLLEGQRLSGDKQIAPDGPTKVEIQQSGKDRIVGSYKMCIDVDGDVTTVSQLKSTGFPTYDNKIKIQMRTWKYRPYMVNGSAVPVCTAITFVYSQK